MTIKEANELKEKIKIKNYEIWTYCSRTHVQEVAYHLNIPEQEAYNQLDTLRTIVILRLEKEISECKSEAKANLEALGCGFDCDEYHNYGCKCGDKDFLCPTCQKAKEIYEEILG